MKRYMVIEYFKEGKLHEIYKRFRNAGRMLPDGLHYIDSWLSNDGSRCFQLMETEHFNLFDEWEKKWMDLAKFEVIELREKPERAHVQADCH